MVGEQVARLTIKERAYSFYGLEMYCPMPVAGQSPENPWCQACGLCKSLARSVASVAPQLVNVTAYQDYVLLE